MVSLRLLLVQESQRGYSPFSNTYCSPLQLGCSYPTHLQGEIHTCCHHRMSQQHLDAWFEALFAAQDLRSTQHQDGAHLLQTRLLQVVAGSSQLMAATLEVFLIVDNQLRGGIVLNLF